MPKLIVIDKIQDFLAIQDYLKSFEFLAYDCETTGLSKDSEIIGVSFCGEEEAAYYIALSKWDVASNSLKITDAGLKEELIKFLKEIKTQFIMHNGIFDSMLAESYFKVSLIDRLHTDTMVLAHLLNENRRIGLKELGKEYFGEDAALEQEKMKKSILTNGGKYTKANLEIYKADMQLLGEYGAKDTLLTYKLFLKLVPELFEQGLDKFFYEEESMPLLRGPTYQLNNTGLKVDQTELIKLKKNLEAECASAKEYIKNEIFKYVQEKYPATKKNNTFNIGSSQQLSWLLFGKLGLEFVTLTKSGQKVSKDLIGSLPYRIPEKSAFIRACLDSSNPKHNNPYKFMACDKNILEKFKNKYKWVATLLEYQKKNKMLSTYVEGIETRMQYGIINPGFLQTGTTSGRYSSRNPNFQNLPRDDKRVKSCIVARPGKVLIGADYSQLEPRVFAYFSQDERLKQAFDGTSDFYSVIGMEVFNKTDCIPQKDGSPDAFGIKYKKLRDLSKVIALASTYGATARQLANSTGKSVDDTKMDIENYFDRFPGVKKMMLAAHDTAKRDGKVLNLFGRPRRMPEAMNITKLYGKVPHTDLPYQIRNTLNLAVNHTIQSTGASIINRAAIRFVNITKEESLDCKIVLQVHDSLVVECKEIDKEEVSTILQFCMENTVELPGIRLEAVPKIGKNLGEV